MKELTIKNYAAKGVNVIKKIWGKTTPKIYKNFRSIGDPPLNTPLAKNVTVYEYRPAKIANK